jgi:hypothetical protein
VGGVGWRRGGGGGGNALHNAGGSGSPVLCSLGPPASWRGPGRLERFSNSKGDSVPPSAIKLKRTETTLDLSQKAEKGMINAARPGEPIRFRGCAGPAGLWPADSPPPPPVSPLPHSRSRPSLFPLEFFSLSGCWPAGRARSRVGAPPGVRGAGAPRAPILGTGNRGWLQGLGRGREAPYAHAPLAAASPPPAYPAPLRCSEPVGECTPSDGGGSQVVRVRSDDGSASLPLSPSPSLSLPLPEGLEQPRARLLRLQYSHDTLTQPPTHPPPAPARSSPLSSRSSSSASRRPTRGAPPLPSRSPPTPKPPAAAPTPPPAPAPAAAVRCRTAPTSSTSSSSSPPPTSPWSSSAGASARRARESLGTTRGGARPGPRSPPRGRARRSTPGRWSRTARSGRAASFSPSLGRGGAAGELAEMRPLSCLSCF